ncbi:hypothetical protein HD806DRAFT_346680 [Xylariaceae sp. AK1471]|nr:hypothetical protein HD806DRAFT_346680 [Xylariaceae sp. AK1471]
MHPSEGKICGIKEVYRPADREAEIDIVAVHGLNGDALRTWTSRKNGECWLYHPDFLPKYIKNARVLVWGYNASFGSLTGVEPSGNRIHNHAQTLIAQLYADRRKGGLTDRSYSFATRLVAWLSREHFHTQILEVPTRLPTCTPSSLAHMASYFLLTSLALPRRFGRFERGLVKALEEESETLQNITDYFTPLMKDFYIHFFWEQEKTDLKYTRDYIVEKESAAPDFDDTERSGIPADHSGMVKFEDSTSSSFRLVAATLERYCEEAPAAINQRWANSNPAFARSRQDNTSETCPKPPPQPPYMPSLPSNPSTYHQKD